MKYRKRGCEREEYFFTGGIREELPSAASSSADRKRKVRPGAGSGKGIVRMYVRAGIRTREYALSILREGLWKSL